MILQELIFPEVGKCTEEKLYFRYDKKKDTKISYEEKKIDMAKNGVVRFDTYFNSFSIEKWTKYTIVDNVSLELFLKGKFCINLYRKEKIHDNIIQTVMTKQIVDCSEKTKIVLDFDCSEKKGVFSFDIESLSEDGVFYGGCYSSKIDEKELRNVKIGICICTYRREAYIEKNLKLLNASILQNANSDVYGHLEVFISDNAKTLDFDKLASDSIHLFKNKNYGGAGGFTRGLIEIYKNNQEYGITHALLMDDDVVIEPEAIVKTYRILTLLKEEHKDAFIGGAMLRKDLQYKQVESGASWNGGYLISNKKDLDLRSVSSVLNNEIEEYTEFNAWWYCCFPFSVVREDNLPLPIFIRGDDVEYGLRNMKELILMNGICVWHEPFENKYSSFLEYYIIRNRLIDNSFHCKWFGKKQLFKTIVGHCFKEIGLYRYKNVDLYLRGVEDFLKGPEWLMAQDSEVLHKEIMGAGYKSEDLNKIGAKFNYTVYDDERSRIDSKWAIYGRWLTFNGLILKAKGETCIPMATARLTNTYRKQRVLQYDVTSGKGFITEKNTKESFKYIFKVINKSIKACNELSKAQELYAKDGLKLRTLSFWEDYLGIK